MYWEVWELMRWRVSWRWVGSENVLELKKYVIKKCCVKWIDVIVEFLEGLFIEWKGGCCEVEGWGEVMFVKWVCWLVLFL